MKQLALKCCLFNLLFLSHLLSADVEKIKLVSNFSIDPARFNPVLKQFGKQAVVVSEDMSLYGIGTKKKPAFFEKWFLHEIKIENDVKKILFFNLTDAIRRDVRFNYLPQDKLILFMWEPPLVLPKMYKKETLERFSKIYTWKDDLVDNKKFFKFYYPVLTPMLSDLPSFEEKKLCTFVGTFLQNEAPGSLYFERIKAINFFEGIGEEGFEFYGRKWNPSLYKNYHGPIDDKLNTIKNYRFTLCYENSCDQNGYITEKIFDCFAAGSVPIYWGAPNVQDYIPKECFIDKRDFATLNDLYIYLKNMERSEYDRYLEKIRTFLKSKEAERFSYAHFEKLFYTSIYE